MAIVGGICAELCNEWLALVALESYGWRTGFRSLLLGPFCLELTNPLEDQSHDPHHTGEAVLGWKDDLVGVGGPGSNPFYPLAGISKG